MLHSWPELRTVASHIPRMNSVCRLTMKVARRIADELAGLAREAREARLDTLAYLIEMARLEAGSAARATGRAGPTFSNANSH